MADLKMMAQALRDPEYWKSVGSGATNALNRGLVGGLIGAPVDVANMVIGSLGFPVLNKPVMGSEWIGQKMQDAGIVSGDRNPVAEGFAGFIDPATLGATAMKAAKYAAPLAAAFGATAIGSKASEGAKLSKMASALRGERGVMAVPGVGIVGGESKAGNGTIFHRFTHGDSPDTGIGYMMFADSPERVSRSYGRSHWTATTDKANSAHIDDIMPDIKKHIEQSGLHDEYMTTPEALAEEFAPSDIVNSAGAWDNPELVQSIYENVLYRKGIDAVVLPDGAIFFDKSHVVRNN